MYPYWETITQPLLTLLRPKIVVEIGSEAGKSTRRLLEFCQRTEATLHAIDPFPKFDVEAWQREFDSCLVFHRAASLAALPHIDRIDAAFIDGDHNWYTVFHELKLIEQRGLELGHPFPLVMLHDIGWPYGRRDLYYDPAAIPVEYRQLYQKKGLRPGSAQLESAGGMNAHLCNAIDENTPRNGVSTAIEDFIGQSEQDFELIQVPGFHGLGILVMRRHQGQNEALGKLLGSLELPPNMRQYLDRLEAVRVATAIRARERQAALEQLEARRLRQVAQLEAKLRAQEAELAKLRQQLQNE